MCFSAQASFATSAVLGVGAVWTLSHEIAPEERLLARIPLLFALQQFVEGMVWVGVVNGDPALTVVFTQVFAFFALFFWPIYVPLAVLRVEPNPRRRRIHEALLIVGLCVAVFLSSSLVARPLATEVIHGHLAYHMGLPHLYAALTLYAAAVSAPCFSSFATLRAFGVMLLSSLVITVWIRAEEFASIWCFFAALLSGLILFHFHSRDRVRMSEPAAGVHTQAVGLRAPVSGADGQAADGGGVGRNGGDVRPQ